MDWLGAGVVRRYGLNVMAKKKNCVHMTAVVSAFIRLSRLAVRLELTKSTAMEAGNIAHNFGYIDIYET
jgi:hypothetical protein